MIEAARVCASIFIGAKSKGNSAPIKRLILNNTLDTIIALQMTVGWAGEGLCVPPRLGWWNTDLIDELGGGDLFQRLFPKSHLWASLEMVRKVAIHADKLARMRAANPDQIRTLFHWGYEIDESLRQRLRELKFLGLPPTSVLPFPAALYEPFSKAEFERAIAYDPKVNFEITPIGRAIAGVMPQELDLCALILASALLPLASTYPMPFFTANHAHILNRRDRSKSCL